MKIINCHLIKLANKKVHICGISDSMSERKQIFQKLFSNANHFMVVHIYIYAIYTLKYTICELYYVQLKNNIINIRCMSSYKLKWVVVCVVTCGFIQKKIMVKCIALTLTYFHLSGMVSLSLYSCYYRTKGKLNLHSSTSIDRFDTFDLILSGK